MSRIIEGERKRTWPKKAAVVMSGLILSAALAGCDKGRNVKEGFTPSDTTPIATEPTLLMIGNQSLQTSTSAMIEANIAGSIKQQPVKETLTSTVNSSKDATRNSIAINTNKTSNETAIKTSVVGSGALSAEASVNSAVSSSVELARKIESRHDAANRFGNDSYSRNFEHWRINASGGAELISDSEASRLKSDGTILEGFLSVAQRRENTIFNAVVLVYYMGADDRFVNGGTVWDFPNDEANAAGDQVIAQVKAREASEQPGVRVFSVCPPPNNPDHFIPLAHRIATREEAAAQFGADSWSRDPSHWTINAFGGATLTTNGQASKIHNLNHGAIAEGWWKVDQRSENTAFDAVGFVTRQNVGDAVVTGATIWIFPEGEAQDGSRQVFNQLKAREAVEQPGAPVLWICNSC